MSAPAPTRPAGARTGFHALELVRADPAADDGSAVALTLRVPQELRERFAFAPGQHVTVRLGTDGGGIRRSYSLCSTPRELRRDGLLRLGVRAVTGGVFSAYVRERLAVGDRLELTAPEGRFTASPAPATAFAGPAGGRRYAAVAAGSGIAPVLSLLTHTLAAEPDSSWTVLYGNRTARSAMFPEELADLKDRYGPRLQVLHFFSREARQVGPAGRRLDAGVLGGVLTSLLPPPLVDEWFVCGPFELVRDARQALDRAGVPAAAVHAELFHADPAPAPARPAPSAPPGGALPDDPLAVLPGVHLEVRLEGRTSSVRVAPGETILDAALSIRPELPFSCRSGVCATCRAKLVSGSAAMRSNFTLTAEETAERYVLTCQAVPTTPAVSVDYDVV